MTNANPAGAIVRDEISIIMEKGQFMAKLWVSRLRREIEIKALWLKRPIVAPPVVASFFSIAALQPDIERRMTGLAIEDRSYASITTQSYPRIMGKITLMVVLDEIVELIIMLVLLLLISEQE